MYKEVTAPIDENGEQDNIEYCKAFADHDAFRIDTEKDDQYQLDNEECCNDIEQFGDMTVDVIDIVFTDFIMFQHDIHDQVDEFLYQKNEENNHDKYSEFAAVKAKWRKVAVKLLSQGRRVHFAGKSEEFRI